MNLPLYQLVQMRTLGTILVLVSLGTSLVFAQGSTATISGVVRNTGGELVPGVSITVKHTESGLTRSVVSGENGGYSVQFLPVGPYELTTSMPGFKLEVRRGINLVVGQEAVINLTMEPGDAAEQVTLTAETPLVNTTLNSTSGLINEEQIKDLPLNGRSFDQLLTLNTGTVNNSSNNRTEASTSFSVAGKRPESNRYLMNGVDYIGTNASGQLITPSGSSGQLLGVEAVREYNVVQHTYGAEYGKRAGAQVTIVSSSGTNEWHGSAFEYLRNSALDARNFFDDTIGAPPFKRNQFGGALGGPLKKGKAFLFGNYEGFRERLAVSSVAIVPDALARQGQLPNVLLGTSKTSPLASAYSPVPNLKAGMLPYANSFWPAPNGPELFDPDGLPTGTAKAFSNPRRKVREDFVLLRFDNRISEKDSFFVNFNHDDGNKATPPADPAFMTLTTQRSYLLGLQETHTFSPVLLNIATLGYSRAGGTQEQAPAGPIPSNLVFLTGTNPGSITIGGGATSVVAAAIAQAPGNTANHDTRDHVTLTDDVRFTKRNHSWSAGAWVQYVQQKLYGTPQFTAGTVNYPTLLAFLQDRPTQFVAVTRLQPLYFRSTEAAWYVQDEMKLRPHLTLRLGLREEMTTGWDEAHNHASNYVFDKSGIIRTSPVIGHSALIENNAKALWQPRIGLAWDPTGTGKWSVRAGFGIHHDLQDNVGSRLNFNPPFGARQTIQNTPLLSIIPIPFGTPPPPSCNAQSPLTPPACGIFTAGGLDPVMKTPTLQQWSLTVERGLTQNLMLQVSYVGSEAYHVVTQMNANMAPPQICSDPQGCFSGGIRPADQAVRVPQGTTYMPSTPPVGILQMRPNPYVGPTQGWFYNATASYHAGGVSLTKRGRGLTFKVNYTYSKILDINSAYIAMLGTNEPPTVLNPFDMKHERGPASYNLKHQFNTNYSYQLPFGRGQHFGGRPREAVDKLISNWQWNGSFAIQSGFPFTPMVGSNSSGSGDTQNPDVPNWNPDFHGRVILGRPEQWFDPRAFAIPAAGTFGNIGRGQLTGPKLTNFDMSLFKKFNIDEKRSLQLRAEAFNIFNHPNFASPNPITFSGNSYSSSAGVITSTSTTSRQIQFALKLLF